tara:strand:+ start:52842 stop:54326 length:1485 start_codon:yes stop_codon:yes gene_type:complete
MKTYWIDLFCGAGGTSTGIHLAGVNTEVLACVNHDAEAIKCHKKNHPNTVHFTEDIRDWNVIQKIKTLADAIRIKDPDAIINIWASLECTHFSKAKGGMARDADSRTLAEHLIRYVKEIDPDYLYIENVREFMSWGPLDANMKPMSSKKGVDYEKWRDGIMNVGYNYDYQLLNSADFGAYTSRERYFGVFGRKGLPITFPKQTHIRKKKLQNSGLKPWKSVKDLLDLQDEGRTIFGLTKMNRPYSDNTLKRILAGLHKFHKEGLFIKRYNGGNPNDKSQSVNAPLGTILCNRTHGLVKPVFLTSYYGNGGSNSVDEPLNTITTKERHAAQFIDYDYSSPTSTDLDSVAGTITTVPKHKLVSAQWIVDTQFSNKGRSIERPAQTLIAKMDKKPLYLISAPEKSQTNHTKVLSTDSKTCIEIKNFMTQNKIADIKIRMLHVEELKSIQGFPDDYELTGTKTNQLKFIGNSVVPLMAQKLVESNFDSLFNKPKIVWL